jgi:hypothetical protein
MMLLIIKFLNFSARFVSSMPRCIDFVMIRIHDYQTLYISGAHRMFDPRSLERRTPLCRHQVWRPVKFQDIETFPQKRYQRGHQLTILRSRMMYIPFQRAYI